MKCGDNWRNAWPKEIKKDPLARPRKLSLRPLIFLPKGRATIRHFSAQLKNKKQKRKNVWRWCTHKWYVFYIWVSVHHKSIIYNKPTRCNSGSIVFIKNYKYALHGIVQCSPTFTSIQDLFQPNSWQTPVAAVTVYSAPDDGRKGRPKHVEHTYSFE